MAATVEIRGLRATEESLTFRALSRPWERLRGLLGTGCHALPVALLRCRSIHTFGMGYRIDVAFVSATGVVVAVWQSVPPGRVLSARKASLVLERPHQRSPWFIPGEHVNIERSAQ